jgi:hypothetical protein
MEAQVIKILAVFLGDEISTHMQRPWLLLFAFMLRTSCKEGNSV